MRPGRLEEAGAALPASEALDGHRHAPAELPDLPARPDLGGVIRMTIAGWRRGGHVARSCPSMLGPPWLPGQMRRPRVRPLRSRTLGAPFATTRPSQRSTVRLCAS